MPAPMRVQAARDRGDLDALRRMRIKATRTRQLNRERAADQAEIAAAEQEEAEEWYKERRREQVREEQEREAIRLHQLDPAVQRQDHLLPEDY